MKVKELLEILQKADPEANILVRSGEDPNNWYSPRQLDENWFQVDFMNNHAANMLLRLTSNEVRPRIRRFTGESNKKRFKTLALF